jgi:hypothetical protein
VAGGAATSSEIINSDPTAQIHGQKLAAGRLAGSTGFSITTQPLRVLRRDAVANLWPLKFYIPLMAAVVVALLALQQQQRAPAQQRQ